MSQQRLLERVVVYVSIDKRGIATRPLFNE